MTRYFWTTADLMAEGRSAREIAALVASGRLTPLRIGLYASPSAPGDLVDVARTGAIATSASAARELGLWVPPGRQLHLALTAGASAPRGASGACLHWSKRVPPARSLPDRVAPLLLALEHAVRCLPREFAIAMIDSALHERRLRPAQLAELALALPLHLRGVIDEVDGQSDSGVESVARVRLRAAGLPVVVHPTLPWVGEVDLLVAGLVIVEVDGKPFHTGVEAFERDRRRDRDAARQGWRTLRFTYRQVMEEWPACLAAVLAALAGIASQ